MIHPKSSCNKTHIPKFLIPVLPPGQSTLYPRDVIVMVKLK